tara:strand:- start:840 stop:1154 length:315 start_codon:yes stop_codon:yes gene_type:complete
MTSKQYLRSLSRRVEFYFKAKETCIHYIKKNDIADVDLQTNLIIMSAVWAAFKLKTVLTEDTLLTLFGLNSDSPQVYKEIGSLDTAYQDLTLIELFDMTVEAFS